MAEDYQTKAVFDYTKLKSLTETGLFTVETTLATPVANTGGFNPHPYYSTYEKLYYTSVDAKAHIDTLTQLVVGKGFEFVGNDKNAIETANEFARTVNLQDILERAILAHFVFGNGYVFIVEGDSNPLKDYPALQVIHPRKVKIKVNEYGEIDGYLYDPTAQFLSEGSADLRDPQTVLDFAHNRVADNVYGISLLHTVYGVLDLKTKITRLLSTLAWRDSHRLLWAEVEISPEELQATTIVNGQEKTLAEAKMEAVAKTLADRVREGIDGTIKVRNNLIFDQSVKLHDLTTSNDYRGIVEVLKFLQGQVDRALKVPKVFLGDPEGSNRATSYNQLRVFTMYIRSVQRRIEAEINKKLMPLVVEGVEFRFKEPIEEDKSAKVEQVYRLANAGILTLGELREYIGYPRELPDEEAENAEKLAEYKEYAKALEREVQEYKELLEQIGQR